MGSAKRPSNGSGPEPIFGDVLRQLRRAAGYTQEELAERAQLSPRGLSDLERGVNHYPRHETVLALASALNLSDEARARLADAARRRGTKADDPQTAVTPRQEEHPGQVAVQIFMIADIRGYTRYAYEHGDEYAAQLTVRFATIAEEAVMAHSGQVLELRGDEVLAVFTSARAALHAATDLQQHLLEAAQANPEDTLRCGIGLDAGEAVPVAGGYRGLAINLAARLCSHAGPGEVLASETIIGLARKVEGISYRDRGMTSFKGFATPVRVIQILPVDASVTSVTPEAAETSQVQPAQATQREAPDLPRGGFLGAQPEHRLVAREREIGVLHAAVDAVRAGTGRLMFLVGEAGVGKTRLAQEVTVSARNLGFLVATGRCYAPQENVPYFPFLEALSRAYMAADATVRDALPEQWPEVARLLPEFRVHQPAASSTFTTGGI
jgi:class 3 adenylate cyclase